MKRSAGIRHVALEDAPDIVTLAQRDDQPWRLCLPSSSTFRSRTPVQDEVLWPNRTVVATVDWLREAVKRGPRTGRRDRAEPLARPTRP